MIASRTINAQLDHAEIVQGLDHTYGLRTGENMYSDTQSSIFP